MSKRRILLLTGLLLAVSLLAIEASEAVRFGLITDLHAHDLDSPLENKWMTHTEERLADFTDAMNVWEPDFIIELGDFINGWVILGEEPGDPARIPDILSWADGLFDAFDGPAYHVIGNHDLYNLDKAEYVEILQMESTAYSFDVGGYHFVVLDVQFALDGTDHANTYMGVSGFVPEPQLAWLREDLETANRPTIVFVHQMLNDFIGEWGRSTVSNQLEVQTLLAEDGQVIAVLQGHDHANTHQLLNGTHFVTFEAMVDRGTPPTWAQITLDPDARQIHIEGVGEQASYELPY